MQMVNHQDSSEFKRGALAASASVFLTYPINKLSIRQSMQGVAASMALSRLRYEGVTSLYKGIGPPLLQKTAGISMMYGVFQIYKRFYEFLLPNSPNIIVYGLSGATSGLVESVLTPFERVQTLLTCPRHALALNNMVSGSFYMLRYFPLKEFYRGWSSVVLRNTISTTLFFFIRDYINAQVPAGKHENLKNFCTGALLGSTLTTVCFPFNATRIYMQGELGVPYQSFSSSFLKLYALRSYSLRKMYLGAGVNALRSLLAWGVINMTYEYLTRYKYFCR